MRIQTCVYACLRGSMAATPGAWIGLTAVMGICVAASPSAAQSPSRSKQPLNSLRALSASVQELTRRVSPSVVQVLVTGYGAINDRGRDDTDLVIGRHRSVGSGAIVDAQGYIVTNAHVVAGARRIQVVLPAPGSADASAGPLAVDDGPTVDARVVGIAREMDLALLKVDATGLRPLLFADYDGVRQGEIVFAFGSPEGLRNSVTMGVVSAVARQLDIDSQAVYVQTDAPINPGNSGGPLVNVEGELIGLNTFILSDSGGSQGLGFAIPSSIIATAYQQLRKYGHLHRGILGLNVQTITPGLAAGLDLSRTSGIVVSDVRPDGPADRSGIHIGDILTTVNSKAVDSPPMLALQLNSHAAGETLALRVIRGSQNLSLTVPVAEQPDAADQLADLADPEKDAVPALGIVGVDITPERASLLPDRRIASGVLVAARELNSQGLEVPLAAGDVIHAVNGVTIRSLDGLRVLLDGPRLETGVVLQIERDGKLMFVTVRFD